MENHARGLSLMEIMITLVIVAVIASLAYPRYQKMVSRSKQTEAKTFLHAIYIAQDLFKTMNQVYTDDLSLLDIEVPDTARYQYSLSISDDGSSFLALATANIDNDLVMDEWRVDQTNKMENSVNDVIEK